METESKSEETKQEEVKIDNPEAVLGALDRAKADAKKFREEKEKLQVDLDSKDQVIAEYSGKLLKEKILQKISEEGVKDPKRLLKFINTSLLSFDDNLEVIGFEDQFNQLKQDLPEIFDPKLRVGGHADSGITNAVNTRMTATELQALKVLGKI